MHFAYAVLPAVSLVWSAAAYAQEPVYAAAPDWVSEAAMADVIVDGAPAQLLQDWQYRLEGGKVTRYTDMAVRIDNPQALMANNTQTLTWLPDKGELTVHRFEIHRAGEVIDLVADGVRFDVLRRERGLERRLLDGQLTASVSVPGLREGDVFRIAHSVTTDDQALGDEVQAAHFLPSEPLQVGQASVTMSWPEGEEMYWAAEERVPLREPETRDGYRWLSVDIPLAEPDPVPRDAPYRFRRPAVLRVGSFASWGEVSDVMAPHFEAAAMLDAGSPVAAEAARIMAETADPLARAALATQLVQDEISYLLNGLDGGNYLPQSAEETWDMRYGDCKAKSVLLLALLREMGIEAELTLVSIDAGDAVPELLPLPAAFNHVIVRATIDGTDYWLDGTSSATRLATLGDVPPFHHALPLRDGGAELVVMEQRALAVPQVAIDAHLDHSAGIDFPALLTVTMTITGPQSANVQAMVDADDPERLRSAPLRWGNGRPLPKRDVAIAYDDQTATGTITISGIAPPTFAWSEGRLRSDLATPDFFRGFSPDRARRSWRDIPVATPGPQRNLFEAAITLPQDGAGFALDGDSESDVSVANQRLVSDIRIDGDMLTLTSEFFAVPGEIAPEDVAETRREARRAVSETTELVPPQDIVWRWQLSDAERRERAAPILAAYEEAIEFAADDDFSAVMMRAAFLADIFDFAGALEDMNTAMTEEPNAALHAARADLHMSLGNFEAAEADLREAYDLDPSNYRAGEIANLLLDLGRVDEALDLLDATPADEDERAGHIGRLAHATAMAGDVAAGQALIDELRDGMPGDGSVLNSDCWYRGVHSSALDDALDICTQAIERTGNTANALDSRALVHWRERRHAEAIADLDAALELEPGKAASHYLRGIVRLDMGDADGREDVETALLIRPSLASRYARYGIAPPQ